MTSKYYCGVLFGVPGIIRHRGGRPFIGWLEESSSLGPWIPYDYLCYSFFCEILAGWIWWTGCRTNACVYFTKSCTELWIYYLAVLPLSTHQEWATELPWQMYNNKQEPIVDQLQCMSHETHHTRERFVGVCHEQRLMLERVSHQWGTGRRRERK